MGKSLNGKELGKGISQRKDGKYMARFTDRFGKSKCLYDKTLNGIRKKLRDAQYEDERALNLASSDMTLDEWFDIWIREFKTNCRDTTICHYKQLYSAIHKTLGQCELRFLNALMIQQALNNIESIPVRKEARMLLITILNQAVETELLNKNPACKLKSIKYKPAAKRILSSDEEVIFFNFAKKRAHYEEYELALETGMRAGEICGLQWDDVDFENKLIRVKRTMIYINKNSNGVNHGLHEPKTSNGERIIPLTARGLKILTAQYGKTGSMPEIKGFGRLVFRTRTDRPIAPGELTQLLGYTCRSIQTLYPDFKPITMHTFRHTFASKAIAKGMRPKTLQKILGHSTLSMTMDLYCHVSDSSLFDEMKKLEA